MLEFKSPKTKHKKIEFDDFSGQADEFEGDGNRCKVLSGSGFRNCIQIEHRTSTARGSGFPATKASRPKAAIIYSRLESRSHRDNTNP